MSLQSDCRSHWVPLWSLCLFVLSLRWCLDVNLFHQDPHLRPSPVSHQSWRTKLETTVLEDVEKSIRHIWFWQRRYLR